MNKINREAFLTALQSLSAGVSQRKLTEQSECIIFQDGNAVSYNEEIFCRVRSPLDPKFTGAVQAKPLVDLLSKMVEEEIEVDPQDGLLWIYGKRKKADLRLEKEILLNVSAIEEPADWLKLPDDFAEAVDIVSACASSDSQKFGLTCLHFAPKHIESCDNIQMVRYKIKTGIAEDFLVRRDSLKSVVPLGMTEFALTASWLHFRNAGGLMISCRRYIDQDFPELGEILKVTGTKTVLPKGLKEAVERAQIFSSEVKDDDKVQVDLRPGKLKVSGRGISGGYEQTSKVNYAGNPMRFMISPKILSEIVQKHNEVEIAPKRLVAGTGPWRYVTCLSVVDDNEPAPPAEPAAVGEED